MTHRLAVKPRNAVLLGLLWAILTLLVYGTAIALLA